MTAPVAQSLSPASSPLDFTFFFLLSFALALLLAVVLARWLRGLAPRFGLVARPDGARHPHASLVPKVGGLAIYAAVGGTVLAVAATTGILASHADQAAALIPILLGAGAMCLLGLWDDVSELAPGRKVLFQTLAAAAVFAAGVRVESFAIPQLGTVELGQVVSLALTILWFVGITNAFNLVDGADGVAGGAALAAAVAMLVVALVLDEPVMALALAATAGAVLGFLYFNFPPASIFLGDAGSLSLGFLLAGLGLASSSKATTVLAIAIPVVSLGLPILDTALAIVRRLLKGQRVTKADLGHVHHRLQALGRSPRQVALITLGACAVFSFASIMLLSPDLRAVGLAFVVVGLTAFLFVQRLRVPELLEFRRVLGRGRHQRELIARNVAIREAASSLRVADSIPALCDHLSVAFGHAGCERAEIWLARDSVEWRSTSPTTGSRSGDGVRIFSWSARNGVRRLGGPEEDPLWEMSLPLVDSSTRETLGRLKLWRAAYGYMPADLQVVTQVVLPEMFRAVARIRGDQLEDAGEWWIPGMGVESDGQAQAM